MASPAHGSPISAHTMIYSCCTPSGMKERIFSEAKALGANRVRVDVELSGIFAGPGEPPNWQQLDDTIALSEEYGLPVVGILLAPPAYISDCPELPDTRLCAVADTAELERLAGEVAAHAAPAIRHWEVLTEPDGAWAYGGTAEDYARTLSASYDGIKARVPDAKVILGGLSRPAQHGWLDRVFATPGANALRKFDIGNLHLRGTVGGVAARYRTFREQLEARGFRGPVWITEHGYPADAPYQWDPAFPGGEGAQAGYLTQSLVGLGEAGADQVFVTFRDNPELRAGYSSEGLVRIGEESPFAASRRPSFAAVRRLIRDWDQIMAWRREQRSYEQAGRAEQGKAASWAGITRLARAALVEARVDVKALERRAARRGTAGRRLARLARRLERARAFLAGRRTALLLYGALTRWHRDRALEHAAQAREFAQKVAG